MTYYFTGIKKNFAYANCQLMTYFY